MNAAGNCHCLIIWYLFAGFKTIILCEVPFQKTKLGIQSLSYVGPNTWDSLPGNLKSATS